jgi:hypothetical protein
MAQIKSALELAMERTASVLGDKAAIGSFEAKQRGKKMANDFLADPNKSFEAELKKAGKEAADLRKGIFDVLKAQISLPYGKADMAKLEVVGKGIAVILSSQPFNMIYKQFLDACNQYIQEAAQYDKAIRQQFAGKIRQKEEALAAQFGQPVRIDPFQDPEFVAAYNQMAAQLRQSYEPLQAQVRSTAEEIFDE